MENSADKLQFAWPKLGNEAVLAFLDESLKNDQVASAYIFSGPDDLGKATIARALAKNLLFRDRPDLASQENAEQDFSSLKSDFYILTCEEGKKNISVEATRDFIHSLSMSSFLDSYKIGLVKGAESLSEGAANALLKTLEEPRDKVVIILLTTNLESLPATIISRAQVLNFYPVPTDQIYDYLLEHYGVSRSVAKNLAALSLGRPLRAVKFLESDAWYLKHLSLAGVLLKLLVRPLNERWSLANGIIGSRASFAESSEEFLLVLEVWQGVLRDLLMLNSGHEDLIQFAALAEELKITYRSLSNSFKDNHNDLNNFLLEKEKLLKKHQDYLQANVSPKNLLDSLIINL
ncbi:MAG: AAA family ATPase [Patescibacteria group bacterium]|nr:AAA family ATPase [Patescibacteria group bacterium]